MPAAWELVVSWCGEPIRADLLQGTVRVDAGGASPEDVPLAVEGRTALARGDGTDGLTLLGVGGASWAVDGVPAAGSEVALGSGVARLALGNLEVAVQRTTPAPRIPRFAPMGGALLGAATFTAAYVLVGLTLYTESPRDRCLCGRDLLEPPRAVTHTDVPAPEAPKPRHRELPRWMAPAPDDATARPVLPDEPTIATVRSARRRAVPARAAVPTTEEAYAVPDLTAELSGAALGDQVVRLEDLADEVPRRPAIAGRRGAGGGVGSCDGPHFATLVARHGRQTAIVACAPAPELGRGPTDRPGHNVVLHERDGGRLAPEVWTWSASPR